MDIRSLRYFIAAYEGGSISAAARRCHVAQPSISTALAQLEEHLGTPLFERHRRGITPTEEGHRLYPWHVRSVKTSMPSAGCFARRRHRRRCAWA